MSKGVVAAESSAFRESLKCTRREAAPGRSPVVGRIRLTNRVSSL
jgi:hypothetical protein